MKDVIERAHESLSPICDHRRERVRFVPGEPTRFSASNFIQTYIDAQGGCGRSTSAQSFVLTGQERQSPFRKPGTDWTDEDLASLRQALAECEAAAAVRGNPYLSTDTKNEIADLLANVPLIVQEARLIREAQIRQLEARRQMAQSRIENATRKKETAKSYADAEVARLENEATLAEGQAQEAIARANRQIDQATHASQDTKAAVADDLAHLRDIPPAIKSYPRSSNPRAAPSSPSRDTRSTNRELLLARFRSYRPRSRRPPPQRTFGCKSVKQLQRASQGILTNNMGLVGTLVQAGECFRSTRE